MRRQPAAGDAAGVAGRLDTLEQRMAVVDELQADVTALGHGIADLTAQVRQLTSTVTARIIRSAGSPTTGSVNATGEDGDEAEETTRDWLTVTDPDLAAQWLHTVDRWAGEVLLPIGLAPVGDCWPLHPVVVSELLAAEAERRNAYASDSPTAVSDWLSRWQPGAHQRIKAELRPCVDDHGHRHNGRTYACLRLDLDLVARWWTDGRGLAPDAVTAFALRQVS
jgi:hypothetical protein